MEALSFLEISKKSLISNIAEFKKVLNRGTLLVLVVKANAYGHGLKEVVSITKGVVDAFQVDDIEELRAIRKVISNKVLVLGYVQKSDLSELVKLDGVLGCYNIETIKELEKIAKKQNKKVAIHLKIDAFLGRQGVLIADLENILSIILKSKHIILESVYSHFSNIEDTNNLLHAQKQFDYLLRAKQVVFDFGFKKITHHISATSGILTNMKGGWGGVYARLGIGAYGLWPSTELGKKNKNKSPLKPILRWVSHIAQIKRVPKSFPIGYGLTFVTKKPTVVALIPQGYSDGYDRGLSNSGEVLVRGKRCKVLGRVAMNMFVVDVSRVSGVVLEDEVVLLGGQGKEDITAEELADKIGTINYEVVARLNPLIPKVVV